MGRGGSRGHHAAVPSKSVELFSTLRKSVPETGSLPEHEKKDLDLVRTCKGKGVVPPSLPETFYTQGLLQACALASLQHQFHRKRDLLTALHLLFGIEEPDSRRLQSHQIFLKKKKKDIVLFPAYHDLSAMHTLTNVWNPRFEKQSNHYEQKSSFNLINMY